MSTSRTNYTIKNIIFGYITSVVSLLIGFASRYIFIKYLGVSYLGVSGLFSNVLGVLSFAELGIGSAINFSLYRPIAQKDYKKTKALMALYKKTYHGIMLIVLGIGLALLPFLQYIVKDPQVVGTLRDLRIFYVIFLLNTISSYVVAYKYGLTNAEQKTYIQTNWEAVTSTVISIMQIICIIFYHDYLAYLIIGLIANYGIKIIINQYFNRKYPIFKDKTDEKIDEEELSKIKKNVKGLIFHRLGEISVYQTDNIIVSAFISINIVGKLANYTMIIDSISRFTNATFNSVIASFGNLIALETDKRQYSVFKEYRFIGFWVYGFCSIMLYIFLSPFILLIFGDALIIDEVSVGLICLDFYLRGHRICVNNVKTAGGVFYQDRYVAFLQAVTNIIISIFFVNIIGLPGVYIGTVIQGLLSNIIKPYYVYRDIFHTKVSDYYIMGIKYFMYFFITAAICTIIKKYVLAHISFGSFFLLFVIILVMINVMFLIFTFHSTEFNLVKNKVSKKTAVLFKWRK